MFATLRQTLHYKIANSALRVEFCKLNLPCEIQTLHCDFFIKNLTEWGFEPETHGFLGE